MNLRAVDLNLLVAFDALIAEGQVTRAAQRLGLSQPATSGALARLRHLFRDELLVRTARGMQPTPRARELAGPVAQLLQQIERVFESDLAFDPATSDRRFTLRLSDLLSLLLMPALSAKLGHTAPKVAIEVVHLPPAATVDALDADRLDLAVSMALDHGSGISSAALLPDRMVAVMRAQHPAAAAPLTLDGFLALRHLRVAMSPTDSRFVDQALARLGRRRDIALTVPHWLTVPAILRQSDLVAVMSERLAAAVGQDLAIRRLPFAADPFDWRLYWHRRHQGSPAHRWLRGTVTAAAA